MSGDAHPLLGGVRALAARAEQHGRDSRGGDEGRVGPVAGTADRRRLAEHAGGRAAHRAHERVVARRSRTARARAACAARRRAADRPRGSGRAARPARPPRPRRSRPAACAARARSCSGPGRSTARARPRSATRAPSRAPSSGCSRSREPRVELADAGEDRAALHDRVDAEVRARAVRGAAGRPRSRARRSPCGRRRARISVGSVTIARVGAQRLERLPARRGSRAPRRPPRPPPRRRAARARRPRGRPPAPRPRPPSCRRRRGRTAGRRRARPVRIAPSPRRRRCRCARTAAASARRRCRGCARSRSAGPAAASSSSASSPASARPVGDEARDLAPRPRRPARARGSPSRSRRAARAARPRPRRSIARRHDPGRLDHQDRRALRRPRPVHDPLRHRVALVRVEHHGLPSSKSISSCPSSTRKNSSSVSCLCQWKSPSMIPSRTTESFTVVSVWLNQGSLRRDLGRDVDQRRVAVLVVEVDRVVVAVHLLLLGAWAFFRAPPGGRTPG